MTQAPLGVGMVLLLPKPNRMSSLKEAFPAQSQVIRGDDLKGPSVMLFQFISPASSLDTDPLLLQTCTLPYLCFTHREPFVAPKICHTA